MVQLAHTAILVLSREFPNIAGLPTNFSTWWKNIMAGNRNLFSISLVHVQKQISHKHRYFKRRFQPKCLPYVCPCLVFFGGKTKWPATTISFQYLWCVFRSKSATSIDQTIISNNRPITNRVTHLSSNICEY